VRKHVLWSAKSDYSLHKIKANGSSMTPVSISPKGVTTRKSQNENSITNVSIYCTNLGSEDRIPQLGAYNVPTRGQRTTS
jgi:hypothetical protein